MKVAFRVDSGLAIGIGHVMRCLALAQALREEGAECLFICREHAGHIASEIGRLGFAVHMLPAPQPLYEAMHASSHAYDAWLGSPWEEDADEVANRLRGQAFDWLIVDHYGIDRRWEGALRPHYDHLLVVDDLANRQHDADILLDQNLAKEARLYARLVPRRCQLLLGPEHALLRPEFAELRQYSLQRRRDSGLGSLLISMGGVDQNNATCAVLSALGNCPLPSTTQVTVVLGPSAPWLNRVRELAASLPWASSVRVAVPDMAQLLANTDLAIGAAGVTSWERCCLGVPALVMVLAANQAPVAAALSAKGAAIAIPSIDDVLRDLPRAIAAMGSGTVLSEASAAAASICDGGGARRVAKQMENQFA